MPGFRESNTKILTEAQNALNIAFGAILSAYVGISLAEIDNKPFDHSLLARFFVALAIFILCLSLGNSVTLRGEYRLGSMFLALGAIAAVVAHGTGRTLGFEVVILRVLAVCWVTALLGSNAVLTAINYLHHRKKR